MILQEAGNGIPKGSTHIKDREGAESEGGGGVGEVDETV